MNTQIDQEVEQEARRMFEADRQAGEPYLENGESIPEWDGIPEMTRHTYRRFAAKGMGRPMPQELEAA